MLIDMHAHTKGISLCCQYDAEKIILNAKKVGIDGIILTNHYQKNYFANVSFADWKQKYVEEYEYTKEVGKKYNIKVFFGVEVSMSFDERVHLLIYGIKKKEFLNLPELFNYSQQDLYNMCDKNNWLLVQAHPYRNGTTILDTNYLHGVEINCHPIYGNAYTEKLISVSKQNGILLTCGCDYHGDVDYRPYGGVLFPDSVENITDMVKFLKNESKKIIYEQEISNREIIKIEF